ncbi:MAG TPA: beta-ketoacyl synthase N-terminal-like domain-containing protein [Vicinamibacterales bacterium]|nr:beta-ketoacyl synthase N-terminal-like domain-containing protein [Vicinamibacterales bacterium]
MRPEDIAVVGVACLFPGAPNVGAFWRNILSKVDAITDPPHEAWDPAVYYDVNADENDRVYCRKGGYLGPLAHFDPLEHGIMPRAVEGGEPDQWLALHVAREALRDAGCLDASAYRERAALILGKGTYANRGTLSVVQHALIVDYTLGVLKSIQPELTEEDLCRIRADLKRRLPRFDAETAPALIPNVTVGRIANRLDIMGPSYTVDAACASSLVAVDIAVKGLRHGEYDLALVGGLQVATPLPVLSLFCQLKALSLTERIRPFDKDADGTLLSEGIGMAVLKRRSQAERDGDRIYAFIKGTGVASDGRAVGVLAPRIEGEELALRRAYTAAGIAPSTVGLIEAHGTGTLVGDAAEVEALARVFGPRVRAPQCALGSVKSMIGHTMPAAGIAGFIKAVLALYHKVLPATLNVTGPSPRLGIERTPFYINTETRPWIHGDATEPRRAGINAFGFGGINAHVVIEEAPAPDDGPTLDTEWDSEVCLFSVASRDEVIGLGRRVAAVLARDPAPALADVAYSLNTQHGAGGPSSTTLGIVARSIDDLARKLDRALTRLGDPTCRKIKDVGGIYYFDEPLARSGRLAFVFPGEGAQYVNMLSDLCRHFPGVRACFDAMDRVLFNHPRGYRLSELVFPPPPFTEAERAAAERRLWQMDVAVEAVVAANQAICTLLKRLGIVPDAVLGHSSGEYSAMRAAGMVDEVHNDQRVVELNDQHGKAAGSGDLPIEAPLIAVGAARERVESLCASIGLTACVAMDNCRYQVVVIADPGAASVLEARLRDEGLLYERLSFDRPYHTPQFEPFARTLRPLLERWIVRPPVVPLYSCTSTTLYPSNLARAQQLAFDHWIRPVEFRRTIENMWRDGFRIFVEAGPRGNLTAFVEDVLADRPFAAISANVSRRTGLLQLHHLIAQLAAHGVALTLEPLYERRRLSRIDWTTDPKQTAPRRSLGAVKLPTGAPAMRLSPEMIELVRTRTSPAARPATLADVAPPPTRSTVEEANPPAAMRSETVESQAISASAQRTGATQVMSAFLHTMDRFLTVEHALINNTFAGVRDAATAYRPLPLIQTVAGGVDGPLVAHCTLDLDQHPFLRDHTFGRNVSADDPLLTGFPIVPFTVLMEIMAEAATALAPQKTVTGMREVRVNRWLAVDRGSLQLEITADWSGDAQVSVRVLDAGASEAGPVAEGVMLLGDSYPIPPAPEPLGLQHERAYKWAPERLYDETMFHGPLFRGVRSIDRVGDNGAEATLTIVPRERLLAPQAADGLVTDFVLLDQPGQAVGFWTSQYLERGFVVLPFRMGALHLYGPPLPAGEQLTCRAHIALVGDHQVRSDLDVVRSDGRLWARFKDWEDRRFELPEAAFRGLLQPASVRLSHPWALVNAAVETNRVIAFRIGLDTFPPGWLHAHGGMWSRVLGALTLGRRERAIWYGLKVPERRRLEWLLGRIAAKDAVRDHLQRHFHLSLRPADVEILPEPSGRPIVTGSWTGQVPRVPLVSISHVDGAAVAVLTDGEGISGVGIDLERYGRMKPGMENVAFGAREREMLESLDGDERQAWALRLWCAKEASAKATGCDVNPVSEGLAVERIHRERGTVVMRYVSPNAGSVTLSASTAREGEWIVATCIR